MMSASRLKLDREAVGPLTVTLEYLPEGYHLVSVRFSNWLTSSEKSVVLRADARTLFLEVVSQLKKGTP